MGDVIVSMEHITKEFPGVKALDDVKFNLRAGEVMALLGENGAGKSTLMKILSGVYSLDQGSLKIFGKDYESLTPSSAREAGVAIIHQELNMCKDLTVAQNMFLGREERKGFVLNNSNMEDIARKYLGELGVDISPANPTISPSYSEKLISLTRRPAFRFLTSNTFLPFSHST